MAKAQAQEPSMEEILASIRRIIADEDKAKPEDAASAPAAEAETHVSEDDLDKLFAADAQEETVTEEDVLDLTEDAVAPPDDTPDAFDDVDDLTFAESGGAFDAVEEPAPPPPAPVSRRAPERPAPAPVVSAAPAARNAPLISAVTDHAVAAAFGSLAGMATHRGGRTIEDLVEDMMRPMLQSWLDINLPPLVERLVRAEIERVARGGR